MNMDYTLAHVVGECIGNGTGCGQRDELEYDYDD